MACCFWKISLGWTVKNSAMAVGYSYSYAESILNRIVTKMENKDQEFIQNKTSHHARGKQRLLSHLQLENWRAIEKKPTDGGLWTGTKVAR